MYSEKVVATSKISILEADYCFPAAFFSEMDSDIVDTRAVQVFVCTTMK